MTGHRPRRRVSSWIVMVAVIGTAVSISASPVSAQWRLTSVWSDVTPGRVTVAPWAVGSGERAAIAVATEDRRIRLRDLEGTVVASVRTGVRNPEGALREGAEHSLLIPPRDSGQSMVRIDHYGNTVQVVGRPTEVDRVLPDDARFVLTDGESLMYAATGRGMVTHAGAGGGVLWNRPLPAAPTTAISYRGAVYVALEDGRIFRFDGNGTGIELVRLSAPVVSMEGTETSSPSLLALTRDGVLSLLELAGTGSNPVTIRWQVQAVDTGVDDASSPDDMGSAEMRLAVSPLRRGANTWYAVVTRPKGGVVVVESDGVQGELILPDTPIDALFTGRVPSGGFLVRSGDSVRLMAPTGDIVDEVELGQVPATMTWVDSAGQLIVTYPDWGIEAWMVRNMRNGTSPVEPHWSESPRRERRQINTVSPGALTARAEAVLAGSSRTERMQLLTEIRSQRRRAVLFNRVGEVRSVLERFLREAFEAPHIQDGQVRNDFPGVRRRTVEELGEIMDRSTREILSEVVRYDPDQRVVAAALEAFARYGVDEVGVTAQAVVRFRRADDRGRDVLAPAMLALLEFTSAEQRHPVAAQEAFELLVESDLSREIRRRAATIQRERYH